jgi:NADPH-dependent 2,4-dienoyl-CoA reductase/sulfur reductase-like enzyme
LSKQFLKGDWSVEKLELRTASSEDLEIEWRLGKQAVALDLVGKHIELAGGERVSYDGLLIATGSRARPFPDAPDLKGLFLLRDLDDAIALRDALDRSPRVVVIGAGFIGMEVAATCRGRGLDVTVVETLETPLVRGLGPVLGEHMARIFLDRGVELRCGIGVMGFEGSDSVEAVVLSDGTRLAADVVVVGIGAVPNCDWLEDSGLEIDNGVACDSSCATAVPGVVTAGDVARWRDERSGKSLRVEHWTNAVEQSEHAAKRLLHGEGVGPYKHVPYVWSDQFDQRIQIAAEVMAGDEMHVCHGSLEEGRFVAIFGRDGELTGAVGFGRPRQLLGFRRLIGEGASWEQALAEAKG